MNKRILLVLALLPILNFAQSAEERRVIASHSNKAANEKLAQELEAENIQRQNRLANYFAAHPEVSKVIYDKHEGKMEIMDVLPNGEFLYAKTDNFGAATTARANHLYSGGSLGLNIQGQGMIAGVWDGDNVLSTHQEFMVNGSSKIQNYDGTTVGSHATHVAGTIASQGLTATARGLAFNSSIYSYNWTNDISEMLLEASYGLLVSNHSYSIGSLGSSWFYGAYDSRAQQIDQLCVNNPFYIPVISAGNSRNDSTPPGSNQIAAKSGYDLIFGQGNAKNVMTVAAVNQVNSYVDEFSVAMSSFSSWGPSDDGRIKPDISMKGVNVYSTYDGSNTDYAYSSGTSMAAPGVTGVLTLLQQYYHQLNNSYMRASMLKGLVLHTADEAGDYPGPDYSFGWGLINAKASAEIIQKKNLSTNGSLLQDATLNNNSTFTKVITASGTAPLKVSISWTDPASTSFNSGTTDPSTIYLVNDLDLKVTSSNGTVYYPWKLQGMGNTTGPATNTGTNNVDNFERVDIPNPSGTYTITVTHKGTLTGASQVFSLVASSSNLGTLATRELNESSVVIYPNPTSDFLNVDDINKIRNAKIIDSTGKLVREFDSFTDKKIDVQNLESGVYYLILNREDDQKEVTLKFIKK